MEKSYLDEEAYGKETNSEKSDEQNTMVEHDNDEFTPVINKHNKRNRNKKNNKKTSPGN